MSDPEHKQRLWAGRGLVTVLAVLPLVLVGFVIGYGVGSHGDRLGTALDEAWEGGEGTVDHRPLAASFTATGVAGPAPEAPAALPVGYSEDLGIAVTHLQFAIDESTVRPDHTAELRLPVAVPPDSEGMTLEIASVHAVRCLCSLTAASAPPYGTVWDVAEVDASSTEVVFDLTGAIDAPGRYGFAVTTPDREAYVEFEGVEYGAGPMLRTVSEPPAPPTPPTPPSRPVPPTAPGPDPTDAGPSPSQDPSAPAAESPLPVADPSTSAEPAPSTGPAPSVDPSAVPGLPAADPTASYPPEAPRDESDRAENQSGSCRTGAKLIPTCGALIGVSPVSHTSKDKEDGHLAFESRVDKTQQIHHAYHRGIEKVFPTADQIALTEDPEHPRTLLLNWKPRVASWAEIAAGDPEVDAFLDRLAAHLEENFDKPFFLTIHHEPENDVVQKDGSGMEAADYAAMYRHVVEHLRAAGADNVVTVMNYMGYLKWVEKPWHHELYPGDDVVDWIGLSGYGQSLKDDGHSDFGEIVDQTNDTAWPGFYHWIAREHPEKPMMLAEWGVFQMDEYPDHQETVFEAARYQMAHYPRLKAVVYFESPDAEGRNSEVHHDPAVLEAFKALMRSPYFQVRLE